MKLMITVAAFLALGNVMALIVPNGETFVGSVQADGIDSSAKPMLAPDPADESTTAAVRTALAQSINDAVIEHKFPDLVMHMAKPDRDHIGAMTGEKYDELNKIIAHFRDDFRTKYHQEFDLKPEQLKDTTVTFGIDKKAVTASLNEGNSKSSTTLPSANTPGDVTAKTGLSVVNGPTVNLVLEGRTAPGVPDAGLWKIDIPNEITGRQLKENLARHLQKVDDQKSTWPADINAAYHSVASQVLQALSDSTLASEQ